MKKMLLSLLVVPALLLAGMASAEAACVCIKIYKPVCGVNGKTYGNSCEAGCAKVPVRCQGQCPCKPTITCANVRCLPPRVCRMVNNRPVCECPKLAIRCAPGYVTAWKLQNGCKIPYCKKVTLSCANVRCAAPTVCRMIGGRPYCTCNGRVCPTGTTCKQVVCVRAPCPPVCTP